MDAISIASAKNAPDPMSAESETSAVPYSTDVEKNPYDVTDSLFNVSDLFNVVDEETTFYTGSSDESLVTWSLRSVASGNLSSRSPSREGVGLVSALPSTTRYIAAAFLTFTCFVGLFGYSVVIFVIVRTRDIGGSLHRRTGSGQDGGSRALLLNSYAAGLIGSGIVIPAYVANISGGRLVYPVAMCRVIGFLNVLTFNALLTTSVAITTRQCLLLMTKTYGRYSWRQTKLIIALSWSLPLAMAIACSRYVGFSAQLLNCLFQTDGGAPPWLPTVVIATPAFVAIAAIFVCYALLFKATRSQQQRTAAQATVSTVLPSTAVRQHGLRTKANVRSAVLAVKLIANWSIFAAFWLPMPCMFIASVRGPVSAESWLVGSLMTRLFYGLGWAVFGIWNRRLRQALKATIFGLHSVKQKRSCSGRSSPQEQPPQAARQRPLTDTITNA